METREQITLEPGKLADLPEGIKLGQHENAYEITCNVELTEMLGDNTIVYITAGKDQAILNANESLNLIDRLGFEGTLSAGTAYVNAATVYDAFGMPDRSIELFEKARAIYEGNLPENDGRLGGL